MTIAIPGNEVRSGVSNGWTVTGYTPTSVTFAGLNITTFDNDSIDILMYSAGLLYPAFGSHPMVVTDGVTTDNITVTLLPTTNYTYTTLTNVSNTAEGYIGHYLS